MKIVTYKDLIVWQKSMELVDSIYVLTNTFPREELYGLTSQIRRASISIPILFQVILLKDHAEGQRKTLETFYCTLLDQVQSWKHK